MSEQRVDPALRVARATPADLEEVGRLTVASYVGPFVEPDDAYVARLADAATRDREAEVWVARAGTEPVLGAVTYCPPGSTWRELARDDEGELRMLAVAGTARRRGVGRALVEVCLGRARADGLRGVRLSSLATMTDAHRLYERLGFERAPADDWSVESTALLAYALRWD